MKKSIIALSLVLFASSGWAAGTLTHATDSTVENAQAGANTAKEKLHQAEHRGSELKTKAQNKAENGGNTTGDKIQEGSQKAWNKTKETTEKGWDSTKEASQKGWDKTKEGASDLKKKVTE